VAEIREITIPYTPRDAFKPFHDRSARWACLVAHRRAGKTVSCINDLIRRAFVDDKVNGRYAYIAPYYSQAKSIAWDYLLRYTEDVRVNANASELWVELLNGARIRLFGADNPDALRGLYLDGVILDEVADMRPRVWGEIIRPLLADREGWAVFIGTPKGHNFFYEIWKTANASDSWFATSIKASTSGLIKAEELKDASQGMTDDQYEQEFECSFEAAILGAYYGKELKVLEDQKRVTTVEYDRSLPVFTAWDLGYHDDTAIFFYQVTHSEIHVIDYFSGSGLAVHDYAEAVTSKGYKYERHYLPHDARAKTLASGGKSIIEQLASYLTISKLAIVPSLSIQDGIQAARLMLPRVWFDKERCESAVELLKQYQREWDEDKKAFRDKPRHDNTSHCADAFRMMAVAWRENKPKIEEKVDKWAVKGENHIIRTDTLDNLWAETKPKNERI
jgi:phage terminase large subunit